jgi:hypothetical protein
MADIDFDEIEEELDLVVPDIYRMFIDAVNAKGYDLQKYGIYHDTQSVLKGNWHQRMHLADSDPKWRNEYFDFGVGDGCGNYFFLRATDEADDLVQLWAHDPPGIEEVSTATDFFTSLLSELESGFTGPGQYLFQGNGSWD